MRQAFTRPESGADGGRNRLYFVSYVASLDTFETMLRRMAGLEDGIPDAPLLDGRLDLRALEG